MFAALPAGRAQAAMPAGRAATLTLVAAITVLQLTNVFHREVNWDEFHFLGQIFQHQRGDLAKALQTFHVHPFGWLTKLPTDEMGMIVTARLVMLGLHLATLWFLHQAAARLVSGPGALLATSAYATILFVVQHATSFRADPIITALLMGSLYLLTRERTGPALLILASIAVALAGLISIKSIFYLPMIAAAACLQLARSTERARLVRDMSVAALLACAVFAGALLLHMAALGQAGAATASAVAGASAKQFIDRELFHGGSFLVHSVLGSPLQWALVLIGGYAAAQAAVRARGIERLQALTLLAMASPLLLVPFYRNSYPYFYVFMLAPAAMLAALSLQASATVRRRAAFIPVLLGVLAAVQVVAQWDRDNRGQRSLLAAVHELFPERAPYIDRAGMIASFPHAGFLMSTWGMENYVKRGEPVLAEAVARQQPVFVIVSGDALSAALMPELLDGAAQYRLLPADEAALRENFVSHWGPLWVAGKTLPPTEGAERTFEVLIAGDYTIEANGPVGIDGEQFLPGQVVELAAGPHTYAGTGAVLRYGHQLPVPARDPPTAVFLGF